LEENVVEDELGNEDCSHCWKQIVQFEETAVEEGLRFGKYLHFRM
jgi:hypothetical protein